MIIIRSLRINESIFFFVESSFDIRSSIKRIEGSFYFISFLRAPVNTYNVRLSLNI